jgi:hypothetical protein
MSEAMRVRPGFPLATETPEPPQLPSPDVGDDVSILGLVRSEDQISYFE